MTREEAIRILDPETTKEELAGIKGYAAMMKVVDEACILAVAALREQEERENLKPLTLEELMDMDAPVWCACKSIDGGNGYWCLNRNGRIVAPSGRCFDVNEIPNWVFLRSKPKEDV